MPISIPEGAVVYIWVIWGLIILVVAAFAAFWAYRSGQFDENIKYQLFTEPDDDIFQPPEDTSARAEAERPQPR
jgi:nitrogen fixation-related uncharacterized protein